MSEDDGSGLKKERKASTGGSRFTIYKVNKASRKKREKSSAKKERKATKTLAIVLGKILIFNLICIENYFLLTFVYIFCFIILHLHSCYFLV